MAYSDLPSLTNPESSLLENPTLHIVLVSAALSRSAGDKSCPCSAAVLQCPDQLVHTAAVSPLIAQQSVKPDTLFVPTRA